MTRKKKIRRAFLLAAGIYIIINIFIFGLMIAYVNTNNIVSSDKVVMAEIKNSAQTTNIEILGKDVTIEKNSEIEKISETAVYALMPYCFRFSAEIIGGLTELFDETIDGLLW